MNKHNLFNQSKYTRWYYAIIQKRAITDRRRRHEVHHIIPECLGGGDEPENLVRLSGHDHAWCHWLLTKMTQGEDRAKMVYAFNMMGVYGEHMEREKSWAIVRAYERNRIEWSKTHSATMKGKTPWNKGKKETRPEVLEKMREGCAKRPPQSKEARERGAEKRRGRKHSAESSKKKRLAMTGLVRGPMSEEEKRKRSDANKGLKKPEGHGANVAAANKGVVSINLNGVEKKVKRDTLDGWLSQGWSLGGRSRLKHVK